MNLLDFFHFDFLFNALCGIFFLSITLGSLSPLVVAKKFAFIGEGIAHSTLLGLAIASIFYSTSFGLYMVTLCITLFFVAILAYSTLRSKIPSDSLIGIYLTATLALGLIIYYQFSSNKSDLLSFLFGNILLIEKMDLYIWISLCALSLMILFFKLHQWIFYAFDEQGARLNGIKIDYYHILFLMLMGVIIVSAVKMAGTILVNALLILPGAFALKIAPSMKSSFVISIAFSLVTSLIGLIISNATNTPPGATLALTQFVLFVTLLLILKKG